jgi:hypothetical protein
MARLGDLLILAVTGRRIRSEHEFDTLFAAAGIYLSGSVPLPSG